MKTFFLTFFMLAVELLFLLTAIYYASKSAWGAACFFMLLTIHWSVDSYLSNLKK